MERHDGRTTDTRERVLRVAEELYHAGGYDRINLQVIADRVGVSKTALFHHFKNKQELFFAVLMRLLDHYRDLARTAFQGERVTTQDKLRRMMRCLTFEQPFDMMRFMRAEHALLTPEQQAALDQAWNASLFAPLREVLAEGVARGAVRDSDLTLSTFAFLHLCMLLPRPDAGIPVVPQFHDTSAQDHVIDVLLDIFMHGVGTTGRTSAPE